MVLYIDEHLIISDAGTDSQLTTDHSPLNHNLTRRIRQLDRHDGFFGCRLRIFDGIIFFERREEVVYFRMNILQITIDADGVHMETVQE